MSATVGATLATHFSSTGVPWSFQRPLRMSVSEDIPLASMPLSTVTSGSAPLGRTVASHCDSAAGSALISRAERCRRLTSVSTVGSLAMR